MKIKISALDRLFSQYIRTRDNWTCQRCLKKHIPPTRGLHCSHFWGRANKSVRFDTENCISLCHGCHSHFTGQPVLHRDWQLKRLGQKRYDALMLRANTPNKPDLEMINLWLREQLKKGE